MLLQPRERYKHTPRRSYTSSLPCWRPRLTHADRPRRANDLIGNAQQRKRGRRNFICSLKDYWRAINLRTHACVWCIIYKISHFFHVFPRFIKQVKKKKEPLTDLAVYYILLRLILYISRRNAPSHVYNNASRAFERVRHQLSLSCEVHGAAVHAHIAAYTYYQFRGEQIHEQKADEMQGPTSGRK